VSGIAEIGRATAYAAGVWGGLTTWAALAQYVLPGRGHALGKLGAFHWVFVINLFPALLCAIGFGAGAMLKRRSVETVMVRWQVLFLAGLLFPLTLRLFRPLFERFGAGMTPALAWCVIGSAIVAAALARRAARD
jgi:hypothetical protein